MEEKRTLFEFNNYEWDGIKLIDYKPDDDSAPTFFNVSRQNIFESKGDINFDIRYFECGVGGFTTLEKHEHAHVVMVLRGQGKIIIGDEIKVVKPFDMVVIPSLAAHQLLNTGKEPFGFVCTVNATRDKFRLLSKDELKEMNQNDKISSLIRVPNGYVDS